MIQFIEPFRGIGTTVNVATVLLGSTLGVAIGHRLPRRTRDRVTDALGLVTLLIGLLAAFDITDPGLRIAVGSSAPVLIVLGSMLIGGIVGSLLRIEQRLESLGGWLQRRLSGTGGGGRPAEAAGVPAATSEHADDRRGRFVEGFVTASMVFCVGPLTVLGSLSDGLGRGADQLLLKALLDGFAAIAFAASFGWGVAASALVVLIVQGALTGLGVVLGDVLPDPHVIALGATGGVLLVGVALRLLDLKQVAVADFLPALLIAPLLVELVTALR